MIMTNKYLPEVSKDELKSFPVEKFNGDIMVIDDSRDLEEALIEIRSCSLLGFDTETRPTFKKGQRNRVALLQLATDDKAWLFRLNSIGLPGILADFLKDTSVVKPGVAIMDDLKGLREWTDFKPGGFIELQNMVKDYGIISAGLKKLSAIVLGYSISKRQQVTNWENEELTEAQLVYAATDAWVCYNIYKTLINGAKL